MLPGLPLQPAKTNEGSVTAHHRHMANRSDVRR
jgi:hypothetical protein